ncbi:MAG: hypothetical protein AAF561_09965 [Planctomycetota bacterium]
MKRDAAITAVGWALAGLAAGVLIVGIGIAIAATPIDRAMAGLLLVVVLSAAASTERLDRVLPLVIGASVVVGLASGSWSIVLLVLICGTLVVAAGCMPAATDSSKVDVARADRDTASLPSFLALVAMVGWILWPVWLGDVLLASGSQVPTWMTRFHPLFALDVATPGVPWIEQAHVYAATPVGADLAIVLPDSPWPAVVVHAAAAAAGLGLRLTISRVRRVRQSSYRTRPDAPQESPAAADAAAPSS